MKERLLHCLVWCSRIHRCRGFGIQSPTDYAFVRYVINEHWPYYAYDELTDDDWLTQKLGRLFFRMANWRQPRLMLRDKWQRYWHAGCRTTIFADSVDTVELAYVEIDDRQTWLGLLPKCNKDSCVIVGGIHRDKTGWQLMLSAPHVGIAYDLYYCGILMFDKKRHPHHYVVNF